MKKILLSTLTLLLALLPSMLQAATIDHGGPYKMWTVPTVYQVDQEVTFFFDMTDAGFAEGVDLYLWCWNPSEPDAGHWENSSDFAKLTYEGDNIYSMTMIPTQYFSGGTTGKTVEEIYNYCQTDDWPGFWARLKTKNGDEESTVFQAPDSRQSWKDMASSGAGVKFYSTSFTGTQLALTDKFTLNEPLTIVFNPDVFKIDGVTMNEFATRDGFNSFNLHSGLNDWTFLQNVAAWDPAGVQKTMLHKQSNGYYTISMKTVFDYYKYNYPNNDGVAVPTGLEKDSEVDNLAWLIVGIINNTWDKNSADAIAKAGTAEVYPDPVFSYFPTKVSALDIITLIRQYNGKRDGELSWKITAGDKTFNGTLSGTRDKRAASVNLLKELASSEATTMHLTITNAAGTTVVDADIPLVPLSEIDN